MTERDRFFPPAVPAAPPPAPAHAAPAPAPAPAAYAAPLRVLFNVRSPAHEQIDLARMMGARVFRVPCQSPRHPLQTQEQDEEEEEEYDNDDFTTVPVTEPGLHDPYWLSCHICEACQERKVQADVAAVCEQGHDSDDGVYDYGN